MPSPSIPSPSRLGALVALALATGALVPAAAAAPAEAASPDPEGDPAARARAHYKQGEDAFKAGRFEEAYRQWQLGFKLSNRPLFLVNMAHAQRRRGDLRNARALYQRFLLMEPQSKLREEVESVLEEIDSTLAAEPAGLGVEARPLEAADPEPAAPVTAGATPAPMLAATAATMVDTAPPPPASAVVPPPIVPPPLLLQGPPPAPPLIDSAAPPPTARASAGPIYRRWWFWAGAGGALALGVAATFLLRGEAYARNGSIGTVGMPP